MAHDEIMSNLSHRCWCEISLPALRHNLATVRQLIPAGCGVIAVVKANAYGHGMAQVGHELEQQHCEMFGCAHIGEALDLRNLGIRSPILLLSSFLKEEAEEIAHEGFHQAISSLEEAQMLEAAAKRYQKKVPVHIKVDTGMSRLGVGPSEFETLYQAVISSPHLALQAVCTHFASADDPTNMTAEQWERFQKIPARDLPRHSANSAGIIGHPLTHGDFVRPGICLYGINPIPDSKQNFVPILSWKSRVTLVKDLAAGATVSYGATYRAEQKMKIAIVAVGYGDGFFRLLSNRGQVLLHGKRCPILGRVTMDQIIIDISALPDTHRGDEVILLGEQGSEKITASDMAEWAETIPYEIWCHITPRVERLHLEEAF